MRYDEEDDYAPVRERSAGVGTVILLSAFTSLIVSALTVIAIQRFGLPDVPGLLARGHAATAAPAAEQAAETSVRVPEVMGMRAEAADELLSARKLRLVIAERRADSALPAGSVLAQKPLAESRVAPGSEVAVVISAGPVRKQVPPELLGMRLEDAKQLLTSSGLRVGPVSESSEGEPGTVIGALPDVGSAIDVGAAVALTVARAPVEMPVIVGLNVKEARNRVEKLGLSVGQLTEVYDSRKRGNRVLAQKPEPGVAVALGTKVDLVVNQGD